MYGFIATTAGCSSLLDRTGARIMDGVFGGMQGPQEHAAAGALTFQLDNWDSSYGRYSFVQFQKGKLVAQAPRWYDSIGTGGEPPRPHSWGRDSEHRLLAPGLQVVGIDQHATPRFGVLRMADLTELLPPRYEAVGGLHTARAKLGGQFIFARSGQDVEVFDLQGRPVSTAAFQRFEEYPSSWSDERDSYVALVNERSQTCRLYTTPMRPLIDADIPLVNGECPNFKAYDKQLRYTDAAGWQHTYQFSHGPSVVPVGPPIWGHVAATLDRALVMRTGDPAAPVYRIVDRNGNDLGAADFTEMHYLGCGFVRLKRGDTWYSVGQDGTLDTGMYFPFSC